MEALVRPFIPTSSASACRLCRWTSKRAKISIKVKCARRLVKNDYSTKTDHGPLHGIRILDFGRILAAPFCSRILADYGAEVIKVEQRKTGDETRNYKIKDESRAWSPEAQPMSFYFAELNRNKQSITLDLKQPAAIEVIHRLVENTDVLLENFIPGRMDKLGIGYSTLSAINPKLLYASISGYGATGPYASRAGYDTIATAEGGLMHVTGSPKGEPVRPGVGMIDMSAGLFAHGAILAALFNRAQTGKGQYIDVSLFETQISMLTNVGTNWINMKQEGQRLGSGHSSAHPLGVWQCRDGLYYALSITQDRQFKILASRLGQPDLAEDERFAKNAARVENRGALDDALRKIFATKTQDEWSQAFENSGIAAGPVNTIQKAFEHPQIQARRMVETFPWADVVGGEWNAIGVPVKFSDTPGRIHSFAPRLGQDTDEVLRKAGYEEAEIDGMREQGVV